ncbi:MAG: Asp-tRNA(Asn)/Glu-tRNA(Gln) amidotransferase subunit GatC [Bacteroidota bacterium]
MSLSQSEIEKIARLARLELTEAEKTEFTSQLNRILGLAAQLEQLDTVGVEPMAHVVPVVNVLRPDRIGQSLDPEKALANAPERKDNFFKVPKIL